MSLEQGMDDISHHSRLSVASFREGAGSLGVADGLGWHGPSTRAVALAPGDPRHVERDELLPPSAGASSPHALALQLPSAQPSALRTGGLPPLPTSSTMASAAALPLHGSHGMAAASPAGLAAGPSTRAGASCLTTTRGASSP